MKIAIHDRENSYSGRWISFCEENNIPFKVVNGYDSDIVDQIKDCTIFMWHYHHTNPKDYLFAKQLLFALEDSGMKVFPDFKTGWHFDDKVAQKYLLEALDLPTINSFVFYDKKSALNWIDKTTFPKVFKLRGGAGSNNVLLAKTKSDGKKLIAQAFGKGFSQYSALKNLQERFRLYKNGKTDLNNVLRGVARIFYTTQYAKVAGREKGYAYFQDFVPDNDSDIRVIVIGDKAFAIKRLVRKDDFRASGSGMILYEKDNFDDEIIKLAFDSTKKLGSKCVAFDFVFLDKKPLIVEISYGFMQKGYEDCPGYWDDSLTWHEGKFNPQYWMIEDLLK